MADFRLLTAVPSADPATMLAVDRRSDGSVALAPGANLHCHMSVNLDKVLRMENIVDAGGEDDMGAYTRLYFDNGQTLDVSDDLMYGPGA